MFSRLRLFFAGTSLKAAQTRESFVGKGMRGILIWFAIGVVGFFLLILASADNEIGLFAWEPLTVLVFIFDILHIEFLALIEPTLFIIFILSNVFLHFQSSLPELYH